MKSEDKYRIIMERMHLKQNKEMYERLNTNLDLTNDEEKIKEYCKKINSSLKGVKEITNEMERDLQERTCMLFLKHLEDLLDSQGWI